MKNSQREINCNTIKTRYQIMQDALMEQEVTRMSKSLSDLTVYDLAGESFGVFLLKNMVGGFCFGLENEQGDEFVEDDLNKYAAEGLADFCKNYLKLYNKIINQ